MSTRLHCVSTGRLPEAELVQSLLREAHTRFSACTEGRNADYIPALAAVRPHRRAIGLAAFATALVHLGFYVAAMGDWAAIRAEILAPGIWTGWAALALLLPLAITSRDAAMRSLGRNWKRLQRLIYPAALLTFIHMGLVHNGWRDALWLAVPLLFLELTRIFPPRTRRIPSKDPA